MAIESRRPVELADDREQLGQLVCFQEPLSGTAECCESQRFLEDHKQADLLDARYDGYRRVSAEQFGDATGVRRRVHPVELTSPEGGADRPGRDIPRLAEDPDLLDEPIWVCKQLPGRRYEQFLTHGIWMTSASGPLNSPIAESGNFLYCCLKPARSRNGARRDMNAAIFISFPAARHWAFSASGAIAPSSEWAVTRCGTAPATAIPYGVPPDCVTIPKRSTPKASIRARWSAGQSATVRPGFRVLP